MSIPGTFEDGATPVRSLLPVHRIDLRDEMKRAGTEIGLDGGRTQRKEPRYVFHLESDSYYTHEDIVPLLTFTLKTAQGGCRNAMGR